MRDPGEIITKTLVREFTEEALNMNNRDIQFDKFGRIVGKTTNYEQKISAFFKNGTQIYKGYVDDPRNTGINITMRNICDVLILEHHIIVEIIIEITRSLFLDKII